jgi:NAD(P)-dependent dehydrogenase (short-subunit alcohol dehydrogenase family)
LSSSELFLVSGGSGGIGAAVCELLAARGFVPIVGYCRRRESAKNIARSCGGDTIALDLASESSIAAAVRELAAQDAVMAGVVLAAGSPLRFSPFAETSDEDMALQWQVNVRGPQRLLGLLVRQCFRKVRRGSVVGILTKAMGGGGRNPTPGMSAYVIAKFGLAGVLGTLAAEYPWLRVRSVSPGYTETPMLEAFDSRFLMFQRQRQEFQTPRQVAMQILTEAVGT